MTLTIPWWVIALLPVVSGMGGFAFFGSRTRDYDFVSPFLAIGSLICGVMCTAGILLGHWM